MKEYDKQFKNEFTKKERIKKLFFGRPLNQLISFYALSLNQYNVFALKKLLYKALSFVRIFMATATLGLGIFMLYEGIIVPFKDITKIALILTFPISALITGTFVSLQVDALKSYNRDNLSNIKNEQYVKYVKKLILENVKEQDKNLYKKIKSNKNFQKYILSKTSTINVAKNYAECLKENTYYYKKKSTDAKIISKTNKKQLSEDTVDKGDEILEKIELPAKIDAKLKEKQIVKTPEQIQAELVARQRLQEEYRILFSSNKSTETKSKTSKTNNKNNHTVVKPRDKKHLYILSVEDDCEIETKIPN